MDMQKYRSCDEPKSTLDLRRAERDAHEVQRRALPVEDGRVSGEDFREVILVAD